MSNDDSGWGEYSRLVLKELETLAVGIKELNESLQEVKRDITEMRAREDKVQELAAWKARIDEVASPSQLKELQKEVDDLKLFKTKAITVFAVIQFAMAAFVFAERFM
jgi:predicted  nucleic acid-binding Zn-ribbon protein